MKVNYLKTDGTKVEGGNAKTFTVNFTYDTGADITIADAVVWNLTKGADATDPSNNTSDLVVNSTDDLFAILNKEFTGKKKPTVRLKSIDLLLEIRFLLMAMSMLMKVVLLILLVRNLLL